MPQKLVKRTTTSTEEFLAPDNGDELDGIPEDSEPEDLLEEEEKRIRRARRARRRR